MSSLVQIGEVPAPAPELDLPELQDEVLSAEQVDVLFADLAAHAQVGEVLLKGAATERADASVQPSLDEAATALREGTARGVQVRYLHGGHEWWDTLLRTPAGVRLVRIQR